MYCAVICDTLMPSLATSPWIRGTPTAHCVATHVSNERARLRGDGRPLAASTLTATANGVERLVLAHVVRGPLA
jgi:hypothetical protein